MENEHRDEILEQQTNETPAVDQTVPEPTYIPNVQNESDNAGHSAEPAVKDKKKGGLFRRLCAIAVGAALFGSVAAVSFYGVSRLMPDNEAQTAVTQSQQGTNPAPTGNDGAQLADLSASTDQVIKSVTVKDDGSLNSQSLDVSDIAEAVMPAMVAITNTSVEEVQNYYGMFGRGQTQLQEVTSSGSGIIISQNDSELLIVTNNHVIDGAETLSVSFVDDEVVSALIKGTDPDNDLAVISVKLADIKDTTKDVIRMATLSTADDLKVGQQVVAIGNALGYGQSVTTGIVSALNRTISTSSAIMIQTDAAINPGNSGGALLNMRGEVIGINSAKYSSTNVEGMGYAISMETAIPVIQTLMNRATREKVEADRASYIGISCEDVTSTIETVYGIPRGVYVTSVVSGGPADKAGITAKNVITHFDGIRITSTSALRDLLEYYAAGETVAVTLQIADGNSYVEKTVTLTLGSAATSQSDSQQSGQK